MPKEAVIVATARTPIGRAYRGALMIQMPPRLAAMLSQKQFTEQESSPVRSMT